MSRPGELVFVVAPTNHNGGLIDSTSANVWPKITMYGHDFRKELHVMYNTISRLGLWDSVRQGPGNNGFMFSSDSFIDEILNDPAVDDCGHSGATGGYALRCMQFIARQGWDAFCKRYDENTLNAVAGNQGKVVADPAAAAAAAAEAQPAAAEAQPAAAAADVGMEIEPVHAPAVAHPQYEDMVAAHSQKKGTWQIRERNFLAETEHAHKLRSQCRGASCGFFARSGQPYNLRRVSPTDASASHNVDNLHHQGQQPQSLKRRRGQ